jgi:hypothetical protein
MRVRAIACDCDAALTLLNFESNSIEAMPPVIARCRSLTDLRFKARTANRSPGFKPLPVLHSAIGHSAALQYAQRTKRVTACSALCGGHAVCGIATSEHTGVPTH